MTPQILIMKVNKLMKKLHIAQHIYLKGKVKFKTDKASFIQNQKHIENPGIFLKEVGG